MDTRFLSKGTQVAYVPSHAQGDLAHPDVQLGFVTSDHGEDAFVRYFYPNGQLRTTANSELTPKRRLVALEHHDPAEIRRVLRELGYDLTPYFINT